MAQAWVGNFKGTPGDPGPAGPQGPAGPKGDAGTALITNNNDEPADTSYTLSAAQNNPTIPGTMANKICTIYDETSQRIMKNGNQLVLNPIMVYKAEQMNILIMLNFINDDGILFASVPLTLYMNKVNDEYRSTYNVPQLLDGTNKDNIVHIRDGSTVYDIKITVSFEKQLPVEYNPSAIVTIDFETETNQTFNVCATLMQSNLPARQN